MIDLDATFQRASDLVGRDAPGAERLCREILAHTPNHPRTNILIGRIALGSGRPGDAVQYLARGVAGEPDRAESHDLLGQAHRKAGQIEAALACYRRAVEIDPTVADFHYHLGNALRAMGQHEDSIVAYVRAIELRPDFGEAHTNLGNAHDDLGRTTEAVRHWERAAARSPRLPEPWFALGRALVDANDPAAAIPLLEQAVGLRPAWAAAHARLARALRGVGRQDDAIARFQVALQLAPRSVDVLFHLGNTLREAGRRGEAEKAYRRLLQLDPRHAEAWNNLGTTLSQLRRREESEHCHRQAIAARPSLAIAWFNLGNMLYETGVLDESVTSFERALELDRSPEMLIGVLRARQAACDWTDLVSGGERLSWAEQDRRRLDIVEAGAAVHPFELIAADAEPRHQLIAARGLSARLRRPVPVARAARPARARIAIGYLCGEWREHATALLCAGLFAAHDRERFTVYGYSYGPDDGSAIRRRIAAGFDQFRDLRTTSDRECAEQIAADGIDVLIDLNGHTGNPRRGILTFRPAPVQVQYLGYPGTMGADGGGAPYIDYGIADRFIATESVIAGFAEPLALLPETYQINDRNRPVPSPHPPRNTLGLPDAGFVFCCFNGSYKIRPPVFDAWMRILQAAPGSALWLLGGPPLVERNLRREAEVRGVDPDRLVFAPRVSQADHLARFGAADLFLDTTPCNAHTTAGDALWAGLPLLTVAGTTFAGRAGGSLVRAAGLPELVVDSIREYERMAVHLAQSPHDLSALRSRLAESRLTCALFDTVRQTRLLERAYGEMWATWVAGGPPRGFIVDPAS